MYNKTVLNNGLRLITYEMPRMQSVSLGVWVRCGGRDESRQNKGIAHFLEHLAFKGSKKYSCRLIKESIEGTGGMLNAFTSEESTCYFAKLPESKQFIALDILTDMIMNPLLNIAEIERERFVILEEIKMHRDLPQSYVHDILEELLWPGHPLGLPIIGEKKIISALKRQDLSRFQKRHYTPSNIVVAACGRLKHQSILNRLKATLGKFKSYEKNTFIPVPDYEKKTMLKILRKKTQQIHMALGCYGLDRDHRDKHIFSLLHVILGANMSSRLFSEVREKRGLAYEIATLIKGFADTGMFVIRAGVDSAKLDKAIEVIIRELDKIKQKLVSSSELRRAKEFYIGQIRLSLEDTLEHMFWIGTPTLHLDKTYSFEGLLKEVRKITPGDLKRVARSIFKAEAMRLAIIGPLKEKEKKLNARIRSL